jgi:hypothetical protein
MLPKQVTDLTAGFVSAFDAEHAPVIEFRKARNTVLATRVARGGGWSSGAVVQIGQHVTAYLEKRTQFAWEKLQAAIASTGMYFYAEMTTDSKDLIAGYFNTSRPAAERFMEEIRQEARAPIGYTMQVQMAFNNILPKLNAEVDLFCAAYAVQRKQSAGNQVFNIGTVHGTVGNIADSQVTVYDCSTVHQPSQPASQASVGKRRTAVAQSPTTRGTDEASFPPFWMPLLREMQVHEPYIHVYLKEAEAAQLSHNPLGETLTIVFPFERGEHSEIFLKLKHSTAIRDILLKLGYGGLQPIVRFAISPKKRTA